MSDDTLASSGDIVLADDDRVYVADGFGGGRDGEYRVSVFDAATGDLVWQRDDLTTEVSVDDVFLQTLVGDTLVVNGQYDSVTAVESAAGEILWSFQLPEGYGAVRSAVVEDVLLVGTEAPREGDIRPPIVYALNLADGSLLWETALAEGTDLQWHSPHVADGLAFVSSTLSHPRSASGNMIHAVDVSTGEVRWIAELGGDQGFHFYPALISGELLVSWSPVGSAIAHRVADGSEVWIQPDVIPMAVDADGTVYAYANGIVGLDPVDGTSTAVVGSDAVGMTVDSIVIHDDQLILTGRSGARSFRIPSGEQLWQIDTPAAVAPSAFTSRLMVVAIDTGVAVFDIPYTADEVRAFVEAFLEKRVDGRGADGDLSSGGLEAFDGAAARGTTELAGRLYEQAGSRYTAGRVVSLDGIEGPDGVTVVEWEVKVELSVAGEAEPVRETLFVAPPAKGDELHVNGGRTGWGGP